MVPLEAHADLEVLFLGELRRLEDLTHPGGIHGHRFLHEHVLVLGHGVGEVLGPEAGGASRG